MVNRAKLETCILLVLFVAMLTVTLMVLTQNNPVFGNAIQPNIACEGYVCEYYKPWLL